MPNLVGFNQCLRRAVLAEHSHLDSGVVVHKSHHIATALVIQRRPERAPRIRVRELPRRRGDNVMSRLGKAHRLRNLTRRAARHRGNADCKRLRHSAPARMHGRMVQLPCHRHRHQRARPIARRSSRKHVRRRGVRRRGELLRRWRTARGNHPVRTMLQQDAPTARSAHHGLLPGRHEERRETKATHVFRGPKRNLEWIADENFTHAVLAIR